VRSTTYLVDKKKIDSVEAKFELVAMDLLQVNSPVENIAGIKGSVGQRLCSRPNAPFLFVINFQVFVSVAVNYI